MSNQSTTTNYVTDSPTHGNSKRRERSCVLHVELLLTLLQLPLVHARLPTPPRRAGPKNVSRETFGLSQRRLLFSLFFFFGLIPRGLCCCLSLNPRTVKRFPIREGDFFIFLICIYNVCIPSARRVKKTHHK